MSQQHTTNKEHEPARVDCVLVYPPWTVLYGRAFLTNCLPPLGLLSIASFLEADGFCVKIIDVNAERLSSQELSARLVEYQPRFVGISVLSSMVVSSHCIAKLVKEVVPDCVVVMGGVHPELYPDLMLRNSSVDAVVRGDGEKPMAQIVAGEDLDQIPGVSYRREDLSVAHNFVGPINMDLDGMPMPAYHLVDFKHYFPSATSYHHLPAMNMIATRGCPGKCTFCNSAKTVLRGRSAENVFQQIKHLHDHHGIRQIQFFDDTFTANKKMVLELCALLAQSNVDISFSCYARGDCFSDKMAQALKSAGCHQIMVGIETGSPKVAEIIGKPIKKAVYQKMVDIARKYDLEVRAGFIVGNLGETWETMKETIDFAMELDVDFFQLSILTPYPGTQLYRQALAEGRLVHTEFKYYGQSKMLVKVDGLNDQDIAAFEKYAFRRFYLRPKMVWRMLKRLKTLRQIKDLFNAFKVLILNRFSKNTPRWTDWDEAKEADQYDLVLKTVRESDYFGNAQDPARLTYEVRTEPETLESIGALR